MNERNPQQPPTITGRIGITLLCIYLLAVTLRIDGCYAPELTPRDELAGIGPAVGDEFPRFTLRDVSGMEVSRDDLRGTDAVIVIVPSLDWSPPTKARVLDLADAAAVRRDVRIAVVIPATQATPRSLAFVRDRDLPFAVLIDDAGLIEQLGLVTPAPDGTPAALPATFVLDANGRVRLRDIRKDARSWLAAPLVLESPAPRPASAGSARTLEPGSVKEVAG